MSGDEGTRCPRSPADFPSSEGHIPTSAQVVLAGHLALGYSLNVRVTASQMSGHSHCKPLLGTNSDPQPQPHKALEQMHLGFGPAQPLFSEKWTVT